MKSHVKMFWFMTFHIQNLFGSKPSSVRFDKVNGFIRVYKGIRYLVLFGIEKYDVFMIKCDILLAKKVVLHILFLIILQK